MMIKKLAIASVAAMGLAGVQFAHAAVGETCTGGDGATCTITATNKAADHPYTAGTDSFVVNSFVFSVSANVGLASLEDPVAIAVGTASNKGRTPYTGSSNGGSVTVCGEATTGSEIPEIPSLELANSGGCGTGEAAASAGSGA